MSPKVDLKLDWCSYEAAKYAVEHWHYSQSMPAGKNVYVGVWEDTIFNGCAIFSRGTDKHIGKPYGLCQKSCVELSRVALSPHSTRTSRIVSIACKMLRQQSPGIRLIVSFADTSRGHVGIIYQASGWIYVGTGILDHRSRPYLGRDGRIYHWRSVCGMLALRRVPLTIAGAVSLGFTPMPLQPKHKYLYPLDSNIKDNIWLLAKPYPKRAASIVHDALPYHGGEGALQATAALHHTEVL